MNIEVKQNCPAMRFELLIDARCRGYVEYYLFNHVVIVTHTEIDPRWEGNGYGSRLARQALDYFSSESKHVVPVCGFFAHQIRRHPEYANLVTMECRRIFDL